MSKVPSTSTDGSEEGELCGDRKGRGRGQEEEEGTGQEEGEGTGGGGRTDIH